MKTAPPEISKTMEPDELRAKLQRAVETIAGLRDDIGTIPHAIMTLEEPGMQPLRYFYAKAERLIQDLTADDIPF